MQIISNELIISKLIKSLTARRVKNLLLTGSSFFLSALTGKTLLWGRPAILTIEPTNVCNLRCPLCITGSGQLRRVQGRMSLDTFRKIMDTMGDDIFFLLLYHQGEPYLNPDFLEMVRMAKQKNIYCTTSTNGHYFDDASIRATIESGLDSMIVSVDGVTQETYARYRVNGKLNKVLQGTKRFMEIKKEMKSKTPLIALQFLVMKHNEHEIPAMNELARELDTTLAITGPVDLITDGKCTCRVSNGHELMGLVTGTGCTATVIIAAFLAVDNDAVQATTTALAYYGFAGEKAATKTQAPGSFQIALLDAIFTIDEKELEQGARIQT